MTITMNWLIDGLCRLSFDLPTNLNEFTNDENMLID